MRLLSLVALAVMQADSRGHTGIDVSDTFWVRQ